MKIGNKIDEYEIIEYIGEGGMGTVFRVCKDGNYYALKTCRTDDEESILRFKREVRIMKSVHDSNYTLQIWSHTLQKHFISKEFARPLFQCAVPPSPSAYKATEKSSGRSGKAVVE